MRDRIWNLRINLDAFNAAFAALAEDGERGQFLAGLSRGMNAGALRDGASAPFLEGFQFGLSMREEAEAFQAKQRDFGKASAEARLAKYGTAQPPRNTFEGPPKHPRTPFEAPSKVPRRYAEPNHNPQSVHIDPSNPAFPPPGANENGTDVLPPADIPDSDGHDYEDIPFRSTLSQGGDR